LTLLSQEKEVDRASRAKQLKKEELGFAGYLQAIKCSGNAELPWHTGPCVLGMERKHWFDRVDNIPDDLYLLLCGQLQDLYTYFFPERRKESVRVLRIPVATSYRLWLFDSELGSRIDKNQSWTASFVRVEFRGRNQRGGGRRIEAAQVEFYAEVLVEEEPEYRRGIKPTQEQQDWMDYTLAEKPETGGPIKRSCTYAFVRYFKEHSNKKNEFGDVVITYYDQFDGPRSHQWVPVLQIKDRFIPYYTTVDDVRVMKPCPVQLAMPI
jgi:hypothetical protein